MSRRLALLGPLVWVACHREAAVDPNPDKLAGTLALDGKPLALVACRPAHAVHTYLVVETDRGALKFADQQLTWSGEPLTCSKLDRSWGGGNRPDGSSYWRVHQTRLP